MAFRFFLPENQAQGVQNNPAPLGVVNADDGRLLERSITVGWLQNPKVSWLDYKCWIECFLDSGIVLHKVLPQQAQTVDSLASVAIDPLVGAVAGGAGIAGVQIAAFNNLPLDTFVNGVNTKSNGQYIDYMQRMATSDYTFVLKGWGLRAGYQVPVPGLVTVAGITPVPGRQWALGNRVEANFSGVPVFFNAWELWYQVSVPPTKNQLPPPNVAQHIRADTTLPTAMQVPFSQPDQNAVPNLPTPPGQKPAAQEGQTDYKVGITR